MGKLNNRSISSVAYDFAQSVRPPKTKYTSVGEVAQAYFEYIRAEYEMDQKASAAPEEYWSSLEFLLGGFGKDDKFPAIYRIGVKGKSVKCQFEKSKTGMCWGGQADSVERIIRGYDSDLREALENYTKELLNSHHKEMSENTVRILNDTLQALKVEMPANVDTSLPVVPKFTFDWKRFKTGVSYSNLPLQEAVDFVSFLVFTQAGKLRFSPGLATVGGRTHIGYATRSEGFVMLNEPQLTHTHTGFL